MNVKVRLEFSILPMILVMGCVATHPNHSKGKQPALAEELVKQDQSVHPSGSLSEHESGDVRIRAIVESWNSNSNQLEVVPRLINLLEDGDPSVRVQVVRTLGRVGYQSTNAALALTKAITDKEWLVRMQSASAFGNIGLESEEVVTALVNALSDENESVRIAALESLGPIGPAAAQTIATRKIYIMGKKHIFDEVASSALIELALQGQILLGNEGIVRNPFFEVGSAKTEFGNQPNVIYGIEDEMALKFAVYLLGYGALAGSAVERSYMVQQLFAVIKYQKQKLMSNDWDLLDKGELTEDERYFYDQVDAFVSSNKDQNSPAFVRLLEESKLDEGRTAEWRGLLRRLILQLTEEIQKLPVEWHPNIEAVRKFIDNPTDAGLFEQLFEEVNISWRDKFITKNAQEVVAIAIEKDLPVYIYVGGGHVLDLTQRLAATYGATNIRAYLHPTPALLKQIKQEAVNFEEYRKSKLQPKVRAH